MNAYPVLGESHHQAPNLIFIDLDLSKDLPYGESIEKLEKAKNKSIKIIKEKLNGCRSTILWTGNGYHIYIVLDIRPLELIKELKDLLSKPSEEFLRYAEMIFSNKKKDCAHNPTFRSSLLRIPYTFNSKNMEEVKIKQEFDKNNISSINTELLKRYNERFSDSKEHNITKKYFWIEKLLQTLIPCFRRFCLFKILVPYLINVIKLSYDKCLNILNEWLKKCSRLSKVYFNIETEIYARVSSVKDYKPISIKKLKNENVELYDVLLSNKIINITD
jgi:hypothetical protein